MARRRQAPLLPAQLGGVHEDWLFRSGQIHPRIVEDVLRENRIDVVIDLAEDRPGSESALAEQRAVEALGIPKVDLPGLNGHGVGAASPRRRTASRST